jgi:zinc/manganese transport system substrate-binding protein
MKCLLLLLTLVSVSHAVSGPPLRVAAAYPYIADLVEKIGQRNVRVWALARGDYNPHVIIPRPSFIAHVRRADLLVISGAQLEIGWLPPILRQANNPYVQPGERGFLDLSRYVTLIDVPASVSREQGDIHPEGNPHFYLDPYNIPLLAKAIAEKLCEIDPSDALYYRSNLDEFVQRWNEKTKEWREKMKQLEQVAVVEYHKNYDYFLRRFGLPIVGTVEPLPGIPPTSKHIEHLESILESHRAQFILQDVYNPDDASRYLANKLGMKLIVLPHDVGAVRGVDDIFSLFDEIVRRLTQ